MMPEVTPLLPAGLRESYESGTPPENEAIPSLTAVHARPHADLASAIRSSLVDDATRAGLLLISGLDDESHSASQRHEGDSDCDYWHGIMHRREPDYGNASYWFRRVGTHPAMSDLPAVAKAEADRFDVEAEASSVLGDEWDPFAVIELCRSAETSPSSDLHTFCRAVQWAEMRALLKHCTATG